MNFDNFEGGSFKASWWNQFNLVLAKGSKEMKAGFYVYDNPDKKTNEDAKPQRYIPDTRKEFIASVLMLENLLFCEYDNEMFKHSKEIREKKIILNKDTELSENDWWSENIELHMELFRGICIFLKRNNWLDKMRDVVE